MRNGLPGKLAGDFPTGGIILDHLFCCKRNVCGDQQKSEAFVIYENDFDLTSERFGHAEQVGAWRARLSGFCRKYGRSCGLAQLI
jgi:hypothetical protein